MTYIRAEGHEPWKTVEELELATLGWVYRRNNERLHGFIGDVPPVEFEKAFYTENHRQISWRGTQAWILCNT